ncbi:hypothetical protein VNO78_07927 [Psophocarpus tetragonolobus]|uniref:Uncharacterized protein n=1 Tax=Psophocarpus tetragonolobus TaxID=3891 RepID=A0AAN9SX14_PSOTE
MTSAPPSLNTGKVSSQKLETENCILVPEEVARRLFRTLITHLGCPSGNSSQEWEHEIKGMDMETLHLFTKHNHRKRHREISLSEEFESLRSNVRNKKGAEVVTIAELIQESQGQGRVIEKEYQIPYCRILDVRHIVVKAEEQCPGKTHLRLVMQAIDREKAVDFKGSR